MSLTSQMFRFRGRMPRKSYWLSLIASVVAAALALVGTKLLFKFGPVARTWESVVIVNIVITVLLAAALLPVMAVTIKRLHDRGRSWRTVVLPALVLYGSLIAQRLVGYWHEGEALVDTQNPMELFFLVGPLFIVPTHGLAPLGAVVSADNAPRLASALQGGLWDYAAAFYAYHTIIGLVEVALGIWFLWEVGLRHGTVGPNRYGPDPLA